MVTCGASLLTRGYVTLHILGSASIYGSLLPLSGLAGLIAADRRWPDPQRLDSFFRAYRPWIFLSADGIVDRPAAYLT